MATLDSLPADQRAVLQLVLGRGRSYDDIGRMLSIDRDAVRERALSALDALAPDTELDAARRGDIADFLLGQLPEVRAHEVGDRLAEHPGERAWARVLAGELVPLGADRLPEIPAGARPSAPAAVAAPARAGAPAPGRAEPAPGGGTPRRGGTSATGTGPDRAPGSERPSSRVGGALLIGAGVLILIVVVLVSVLSGGSDNHRSATTASTPVRSSSASASTATTSSATASARPIAQVNLTSPSGAKTPGGAAVVVRQGTQTGLVIRAVGLPANTKHDAYAVWLNTPGGASQILGFVNPAVSTNGVLQTAGVLPAGVSRFSQLLVTLETQAKPKAPGKVVLQGALKLSG